MLHLFSWQVIEKQHRMMEQLGSQIKVFISSHLNIYTLEIGLSKLFSCVMDRSLSSVGHMSQYSPVYYRC